MRKTRQGFEGGNWAEGAYIKTGGWWDCAGLGIL